MKIDLTNKERATLLTAIEALIEKQGDTVSHEKLVRKLLGD
jgi:hypothetical protein